MHAPPPVRPVTVSLLPPFERFVEELRSIWDTHWLTNSGAKLQAFEAALRQRLRCGPLLAFVNGGAALHAAVHALRLPPGEIVTTPFTFAASTHVIALAGHEPVFADVDEATLTLDPARVEAAITPRTRAILGVHVFGVPCHVEALAEISRRHGLPVIYDGAHAFGVEVGGRPVTDWGDATMLSFNATKLLTTGEGGCLVFRDPALEAELRRWRRWGMLDDGVVTQPGLNGMMTEMQAALGLCNLEMLGAECAARGHVVSAYRQAFAGRPDVRLCSEPPAGVTPALSYFVIRVPAERRPAVLDALRRAQVLAKPYFHPLTSDFPCYRQCPGATAANLPVATRVAQETLSLPLYGALGEEGATFVVAVVNDALT